MEMFYLLKQDICKKLCILTSYEAKNWELIGINNDSIILGQVRVTKLL